MEMKTNFNLGSLIFSLQGEGVGDRRILEIMGIDLYSEQGDDSQRWLWLCSVEKKWWGIDFFRATIDGSDHEVWWSKCPEIGVADIEFRESPGDGEFAEYCQQIAENTGSCDGAVRRVV
jgi:hypothetical protein